MADLMTLDMAIEEYEAKFGDVPRIVIESKGFDHDKIEQLLIAVDTNEPIDDREDIDDLAL